MRSVSALPLLLIGACMFHSAHSINPVYRFHSTESKKKGTNRFEIYLQHKPDVSKIDADELIKFVENYFKFKQDYSEDEKVRLEQLLPKMKEKSQFFTEAVMAYGKFFKIRVAFSVTIEEFDFEELSLSYKNKDKDKEEHEDKDKDKEEHKNQYFIKQLLEEIEDFHWDKEENEVYRYQNGGLFYDKQARLMIESASKKIEPKDYPRIGRVMENRFGGPKLEEKNFCHVATQLYQNSPTVYRHFFKISTPYEDEAGPSQSLQPVSKRFPMLEKKSRSSSPTRRSPSPVRKSSRSSTEESQSVIFDIKKGKSFEIKDLQEKLQNLPNIELDPRYASKCAHLNAEIQSIRQKKEKVECKIIYRPHQRYFSFVLHAYNNKKRQKVHVNDFLQINEHDPSKVRNIQLYYVDSNFTKEGNISSLDIFCLHETSWEALHPILQKNKLLPNNPFQMNGKEIEHLTTFKTVSFTLKKQKQKKRHGTSNSDDKKASKKSTSPRLQRRQETKAKRVLSKSMNNEPSLASKIKI